MKITKLRIATRKSPLALWQAEYVKSELEKHFPFLQFDLLGMLTTAEKFITTPLANIGGKGLFVKELENALLEHQADIAVHSMKDVPTQLPENLEIAVICKREDPRDAFVSNQFENFFTLTKGCKIGTSSLRRQSQLKSLRSDLEFKDLRGNVGSRLERLDDGHFDGIILAAAGLERLQQQNRINHYFETKTLLPAAGQGAIGIECRKEDEDILNIISVLNHIPTFICVIAERVVSDRLGGSCKVPVASYATLDNEQLTIVGLVSAIDGSVVLKSSRTGHYETAEVLAHQVADDLLAKGADKIIHNCLK